MITEYQITIWETEFEATDYAEEIGDRFVRFTGTSWNTCDDGDYCVVEKSEY